MTIQDVINTPPDTPVSGFSGVLGPVEERSGNYGVYWTSILNDPQVPSLMLSVMSSKDISTLQNQEVMLGGSGIKRKPNYGTTAQIGIGKASSVTLRGQSDGTTVQGTMPMVINPSSPPVIMPTVKAPVYQGITVGNMMKIASAIYLEKKDLLEKPWSPDGKNAIYRIASDLLRIDEKLGKGQLAAIPAEDRPEPPTPPVQEQIAEPVGTYSVADEDVPF